MRLKVSKVVLLVGTVFLLAQCTSDKSPAPAPDLTRDTIRFKADIKPIFQTNCAQSGCHNQAGILNYALKEYEGIKRGVTQGRVLGAINHKQGYYNMPNGRKLPDTTITKVERWADSGAPKNKPVIVEPD
jgi:hypothetical protein